MVCAKKHAITLKNDVVVKGFTTKTKKIAKINCIFPLGHEMVWVKNPCFLATNTTFSNFSSSDFAREAKKSEKMKNQFLL